MGSGLGEGVMFSGSGHGFRITSNSDTNTVFFPQVSKKDKWDKYVERMGHDYKKENVVQYISKQLIRGLRIPKKWLLMRGEDRIWRKW